MGLGVTRESVGDILVAEQSVDVLVAEPVRRFLLDSWDSAGRVRLKVHDRILKAVRIARDFGQPWSDTGAPGRTVG